jgi:hypothetical protein
MADIDKAALLEALGHDDAAKLIRALDSGEPVAGAKAEPDEPKQTPGEAFHRELTERTQSQWVSTPILGEQRRQEEGQALLDAMRKSGIRAAQGGRDDG